MFLEDVINHTKSVLPLFTDKFSANFEILTLSKTGTTVSVTALAHGLIVSDNIVIANVRTEIEITGISTDVQSNGKNIVTVVCSENHSFSKVKAHAAIPKYANITSLEPNYTGVFGIKEVIDCKKFTFILDDLEPGPSTGNLLTFHDLGFNGPQTVTAIIDSDNFEYELDAPVPDVMGVGDDMEFRKGIRISGGADFSRFDKIYLKDNSQRMWGFFHVPSIDVNQDRNINTDASNEKSVGQDLKIIHIANLDFYVFIHSEDDLGRAAFDLARDLSKYINKTLSGFIIRTPYIGQTRQFLVSNGETIEDFIVPYMIYKYSFQTTFDLESNLVDTNKTAFMAESGDTLPLFGSVPIKQIDWKIHDSETNVVLKDDSITIQEDG